MNPEKQMNLTMLCDYYELTMTNGYYACGMQNRITYFDIFFRSVPDGGGFAIAAGLEQAIRYIQSTRHPEADITGFIRRHIDRLDSLDLIVREEADKQRIWARLEDTVPDIYITSSVRQLIEISHRDAGKHSGVRFVAERLRLSPADIAAFGDGDNDADMLSYVGCGIAMANASPACLAAADHITLDHREDGVAHGIYHMLKL